jgi:hypothetical protein
MNHHGVEDMYRLLKTQLGYKERSLPTAFCWWNVRVVGEALFLLFPWWVFGISSDSHPPRWSKQDYIHLPVWNICIQRMSFRLCNAPTSFQWCMMFIFSNRIEEIMEVFMDDFSVYGKTFDHCLENLDIVLQRCQGKDLVLNWETAISWSEKASSLGTLCPRGGSRLSSNYRPLW